MGVLCRLCVAAAVSSLSVWYVSTSEDKLKMFSVQSAAAQVQLQALAESAATTFTEQSVSARAFGNSALVAVRVRLSVALVEGQALGSFMVHACGEHATAAKIQLLALSASVFEMGGEHTAWALQYLGDMHFAEMPEQLYNSSLPAMKKLKASVVSTSRRFIHEVFIYDVSTFPDSCRTVVASLKELSRSATPLQLAGSIILSMIAMIVFTRCLRTICCCRRGRVLAAPTGEAINARSEILLAPSPLRERYSQPPQAPLRRRRSESPGATAKENASGASEVNREVAEQDVLNHLNTATPEELRMVSGLGDKSVNKILKYRSKEGELESLGDLVHKVGIHGATFANFAKAQGI